MAFLTSLDILDTGFLDVATRTNQLASGNRVNSGNEMRLKSVEISFESSGNLDKAVTPAFNPATIKGHEKRSLISVNPIKVTIKVFLNTLFTDTSNHYAIDDMALLAPLLELPHTRGWKAIYYPVDNTATDGGGNTTNRRDQQMVYQLGATDTAESQGDIDITIWTGAASAGSKDLTDVNYVPVRFDSCTPMQLPSNKLMVTLTGVVTG